MKNPFLGEVIVYRRHTNCPAYYLSVAPNGIFQKAQATYAADAINTREALEERVEKLEKMLRRSGCYISATVNMYDYTSASQLKRDIDALLAEEKD